MFLDDLSDICKDLNIYIYIFFFLTVASSSFTVASSKGHTRLVVIKDLNIEAIYV